MCDGQRSTGSTGLVARPAPLRGVGGRQRGQRRRDPEACGRRAGPPTGSPGSPGSSFRRRWPAGVHGWPGMARHVFGKTGPDLPNDVLGLARPRARRGPVLWVVGSGGGAAAHVRRSDWVWRMCGGDGRVLRPPEAITMRQHHASGRCCKMCGKCGECAVNVRDNVRGAGAGHDTCTQLGGGIWGQTTHWFQLARIDPTPPELKSSPLVREVEAPQKAGVCVPQHELLDSAQSARGGTSVGMPRAGGGGESAFSLFLPSGTTPRDKTSPASFWG
eukprot:gene13406-biopygen21559